MQIARPRPGGLAKFHPQRAVKQIAFLEMAEKYYARAKDATKLVEAIRSKLEAQAEFVRWWDLHGPGREGKGNVSGRKHFAGREGLPDRLVVHRWRGKLNNPEKFARAVESACARYPRLLEFSATPHVGQNSGEAEWYTPSDLIEAARSALGGIDLDPASSATANRVVRARRIFTSTDDGLTKRWAGRIWLNPPFAYPLISVFAEKLAVEVRSGRVIAACVLVNNATETGWFRSLADCASAICFPTGRTRFWSPTQESAAPLQGQAVLYIGPDRKKFAAAFADFGFLVTVPTR